MVQWKGNLDSKQVGKKAANLDSISELEVPNFFVLTKREVGKFLGDEPRSIINSQMPEELKQRIQDAYDDIGMSSEVRNASGQARDLVGGQRENQRVSVRISSEQGTGDYKLNIGSSSIENAVKEVLASYYKENDDAPAIIIQKMIEPDYTGAIINNYTRRHTLVETVEGLGHSLEEGSTVPEFYLLEQNKLVETRTPSKQAKVTRNPMNGQRRTRTVSKNSEAFQKSEIEKIAKKTSRKGYNLKFVYKRGTFYIVDAFKTQPMRIEPDLEALKVSEGEIKGRRGEDYEVVEEPQDMDKPQVARKGGYTTEQAYRARQKNLPAVFSLSNMDKIRGREEKTEKHGKNVETQERNQEVQESSSVSEAVTATEIRSLKDFPQLSDNPFNLNDSEVSFADTCEEVLAEGSELIDGRQIKKKALAKIIEINQSTRVLAVNSLEDGLADSIVQKGVEVLAVPENKVESAERKILKAEKKFILENLRN